MEPPMAKEPEQGLGCMLAIVCLGILGVFPFLFGSMSQNLFVCYCSIQIIGMGYLGSIMYICHKDSRGVLLCI